jgi:low temperature requirement protein LtrA
MLVKALANVSNESSNANLPFHIAFLKAHLEVAQVYINKSRDVNNDRSLQLTHKRLGMVITTRSVFTLDNLHFEPKLKSDVLLIIY